MTYRARIRVELPDRPGALAAAAGAIAAHGGNVVGIDVHEVDVDTVRDELVVDLPDDVDPDTIGRELMVSAAGRLLSARPGDGRSDPVLRTLRWACALVAAGADGEDELARAVAEVCGTSAVWILSASAAFMFEAGRLAVGRGKPVAHRTEDVPAHLAPGSDEEWWLIAVPDARIDPARVAFVARPVTHRFDATEIARVEALLALLRQVDVAVAGPLTALAG